MAAQPADASEPDGLAGAPAVRTLQLFHQF